MASYTVAMTGASGAIYGVTLVERLAEAGHEIALVVSPDGVTVLREETGIDWSGKPPSVQRALDRRYHGRVTWWEPGNFYAPIYTLLLWLAVDGVVDTLIFVFLGLLAARRIVRTNQLLQTRAELIGQGNLN